MVYIMTPANGEHIDPALIEWDEVEKLWLYGGLHRNDRPVPFSLWAVMKHDAQIELMAKAEAAAMRREGVRLAAEYGVPFDDWSVPALPVADPVGAIIADIEAAIFEGDEVGGRRGGVSDHAFSAGKSEAAFLEALALATCSASVALVRRGHPDDEISSGIQEVIDRERHRFRSLCDAAGRVRDMAP